MAYLKSTEKKLIGGFFEMSLPKMSTQLNMAQQLKLPENPALRFTNARSALFVLITVLQPKKVWIPAYICSSIIDAIRVCNTPIYYYSVNDTLEPDVTQLNRDCVAGDIILGINYFGQPPNPLFRHFTMKRTDLIFIEDCAQTIDTGETAWGHWQLFSPRKLLGIADGGYASQTSQIKDYKFPLSVKKSLEINKWMAAFLRFEDNEEKNNQYWHLVNQKREKSMGINNTQMSHLSCEILKRIDALTLIKQRKNNFITLYKKLSHLAFLKIKTPNFCPFGFPIQIDNKLRTIINEKLIERGIFPAIHWDSLPSPKDEFQKEHVLSKELLTLPCDQRYRVTDMEYIATNVLDILKAHT